MLLLEIQGSLRPEHLSQIFQSSESVQLIPFATLGDSSLKIQLERDCETRFAQIRSALGALGVQILGYRWKEEVSVCVTQSQTQVAKVPSSRVGWGARLSKALG
jgi:hypothetical protein